MSGQNDPVLIVRGTTVSKSTKSKTAVCNLDPPLAISRVLHLEYMFYVLMLVFTVAVQHLRMSEQLNTVVFCHLVPQTSFFFVCSAMYRMYAKSHMLGMSIIAVPPRILVR